MRVDISFLPALAAAFLLAFARVGTMVMLLPGVGEQTMPSRVRHAVIDSLAKVDAEAARRLKTGVELAASRGWATCGRRGSRSGIRRLR